MEHLATTAFWLDLLKIIGIDIVLAGDNAVVIALAARSLPPRQQRQAVMWGAGAAVVMRVSLTVVAAYLLQLPWLKVIGGLLLLWIGIQLLNEHSEGEGGYKPQGSMFAAIRTIMIADLVMSLDNIIAVAAAAKDNIVLLILGLGISIPLVVFGSTLLIRLMQRLPWIIVLGAALIGWVGGETIVKDRVLEGWMAGQPWLLEPRMFDHPWSFWAAAAIGAMLVVVIGKALAARTRNTVPVSAGASGSH
jgi:YjbE family integral membrane protein